MKRTKPGILLVLAAIGFVAGYVTETALVGAGRAMFVPPWTLPATLVTVAAVAIIPAIQIRRAVTGNGKHRVQPLQAARVAVLAKASSHAGALLSGAAGAVLVYFLLRSVTPALSSMWLAGATVIAALALTGAGAVAEFLCTLPKDDDDDTPGVPGNA